MHTRGLSISRCPETIVSEYRTRSHKLRALWCWRECFPRVSHSGPPPGPGGCPGAQNSVKNPRSSTFYLPPPQALWYWRECFPRVLHTPKVFILFGRTYWRILDFSFGGRTENRFEVASEVVSGADPMCVLHHFYSLTRLKGSWGQV